MVIGCYISTILLNLQVSWYNSGNCNIENHHPIHCKSPELLFTCILYSFWADSTYTGAGHIWIFFAAVRNTDHEFRFLVWLAIIGPHHSVSREWYAVPVVHRCKPSGCFFSVIVFCQEENTMTKRKWMANGKWTVERNIMKCYDIWIFLCARMSLAILTSSRIHEIDWKLCTLRCTHEVTFVSGEVLCG